jgi:ABC-type transport system substrate-binding protein
LAVEHDVTAYDVRARQTAAAMLAPVGTSTRAKGQAVTLHEPAGAATYDPATGTTSAGTPAEHTGSGIEEAYSAYSIAQGLVAARDRKFLLSALKIDGSAMPRPVADAWTITLADGVTYAIKNVSATSPAGTDIMFELQLRQG